MTLPARTLVGTVGYHNLCNHSIGPILLPRLRRLSWPPGVLVEELNWGPVAIAQRLQTESPPFDRIVLVGARPGDLAEGTVTLYRWAGGLPPPHEVQARMGEAVTGVISIDNLLVVGEYLSVWPPQMYVVDIAPGAQQSGPQLTPRVAAMIPHIMGRVREVALSDSAEGLDWLPLGGEDLRLEGEQLGTAATKQR